MGSTCEALRAGRYPAKSATTVISKTAMATLSGSRQTLYRLHKKAGVWKIVGFIGYLPLKT